MTSGLPAVRPDHHRRPPLDGQNLVRHEHRRECLHRRRQSGRRVLAGNVERGAAAASALLAAPASTRTRCAPVRSGATTCRKLSTPWKQLAHAPIFIDDTPGISVSEMRAKARRLQAVAGQARPDHRRLPPAHVRRQQALRKPHPGSVRHLARTESGRQGTRRSRWSRSRS